MQTKNVRNEKSWFTNEIISINQRNYASHKRKIYRSTLEL